MPQLIINYDQTGVYIRPNQSQTFEERGSKQVSVVGNDEKRAYTLGVASTADGTLLPLEQVWSGSTAKSLPKSTADGFQEAKAHGFHFTFAASKKKTSHFSTLKTMKELIQFVISPYVSDIISADPDLDEDQKCIFFIDIYPVHTSEPFRTFVFDEYPNIILIFVPGNCTGIMQPQDVGLQRVTKHHLRQSMLENLVRCHQAQIAEGISADKVIFSNSYPVLRDASVRACVDVYTWLTSPEGRDIVKRAWERCVVPGKAEYNLGYPCLSSRESRKALRKYLQTDKILADEIKARLGAITLPDTPTDGGIVDTEITDGIDAEDKELEDDEPTDDSDIPLADVVLDALGLRVDAPTHTYNTRRSTTKSSGGLVAADAAEDIWAFNNEGRLWEDVGAPVEKSDSESEEDSGDNYDGASDEEE